MKFPATKDEQNDTKPAIKRLLDAHGWFWWGMPASPYGKSGISDIMAVRPGVFMVIEAKHTQTSHGKKGPTPRQLGFLNQIKDAKHFAFLVNELNLDQFEIFLTNFEHAAQYAAKNQKPPVEVGGPLLDAIIALTNYPQVTEANM